MYIYYNIYTGEREREREEERKIEGGGEGDTRVKEI